MLWVTLYKCQTCYIDFPQSANLNILWQKKSNLIYWLSVESSLIATNLSWPNIKRVYWKGSQVTRLAHPAGAPFTTKPSQNRLTNWNFDWTLLKCTCFPANPPREQEYKRKCKTNLARRKLTTRGAITGQTFLIWIYLSLKISNKGSLVLERHKAG